MYPDDRSWAAAVGRIISVPFCFEFTRSVCACRREANAKWNARQQIEYSFSPAYSCCWLLCNPACDMLMRWNKKIWSRARLGCCWTCNMSLWMIPSRVIFFLFYFISCVHCPHQYNSGLFRICCIFRLLIGRRWWWINNGVIAHSKQMFVCVVNSAEIQRKKSKQKRVFVNKWNFMLHSIICFLLILYEALSLGNAGNGMIRHGQIRFDNATN